MIELASALSLPLAKLLLKSWLGDTASDIGESLLKLGFERAGRAQQNAERLADAVTGDLARFFANEHVDEERLKVVASALRDTIRTRVDAAFLVSQRLNAAAIKTALLDARRPETIYRTAEPEHDLYIRLVSALAPRLRAVAPELPGFELERDAALLRMTEVADHVAEVLAAIKPIVEKTARDVEELVDRPRRLAEGFERDFLDAVLQELDYVEILGIEELDAKTRRAGLSVAYLSLTARLRTGDDQQKLDFATLLALLPVLGNRLFIEGAAGSGKSTLARWAAIQAARWRLGRTDDRDILDVAPDVDSWLAFLRPDRDVRESFDEVARRGPGLAEAPAPALEGQPQATDTKREAHHRGEVREHPLKGQLRAEAWRDRVPFVVYLRNAGGHLDLRDLPHAVVRSIPEPPEGWLQEAFAGAGANVVLIFDGVDEVPVGKPRDALLAEIANFAKRFPKAQIIVTSRPGAAALSVLPGFEKVELEELSEGQQREFIAHWHHALAANYQRSRDDTAVAALQQAVYRELEQQRALAQLATNPLLCAAVCALHWLSRRKVVEEAWSSRADFAGFTIEGTVLPASRWNLCEKLTYMLVHQRDLDRELGGETFGAAYHLSYELKREILARIAYDMVASDLLSAMTRIDAQRHVEAALAAYRGEIKASAEDVLQALLERSGVLRGSGQDAVEYVHNTLKAFLAAKFYLGLLTPDEVVRRIAVGTAKELASGLDEIAVFAAASPDHPSYAQSLIEALLSGHDGRRPWLDFLNWGREKSSDLRRFRILALRCEAAASSHLPQETRSKVRANASALFPPRDMDEARQLAALGPEAIASLSYQPEASDTENAAAVRCLTLIGTTAAREAMKDYLQTKSLSVAEELLPHFRGLEIRAVVEAASDFLAWIKVSPSIKSRIVDLGPLTGLTNLQTLYLSGTQVADLSPLAGLTNLQSLDLNDTQVADLSPLAGLADLQTLDLSDAQVADLSPLAGVTNLQSLDLINTQVADLSPLARLTNLQSLSLGLTQVAESLLAGLTNLQSLDLIGTQVADLSPLAGVTNLQTLDLRGTQVPKAQVARLREALPNLRVIQ